MRGRWIGAALLAAACTPPVPGDFQTASSLDPSALTSRGIMVAGAIDVGRPVEIDHVLWIAGIVTDAFEVERPDLVFLSAGKVAQRLGQEDYETMLTGYRDGGTLGDGVSLLAKRFPGVRFALLARVERSSVHKDQTERNVKRNAAGEVIRSDIRYTTSRTVEVACDLVDLESGEVVFRGHVRRTEDANNNARSDNDRTADRRRRSKDLGKQIRDELLITAIEVLAGEDEAKDPYPAAPAEKYALRDVFRELAAGLPKPQSPTP